jgi:O-antigen/teichoic acid export membrane protein
MNSAISTSAFIALIIATLSICYIVALIYMYLTSRHNFKFLKNVVPSKFNSEEVVQLRKFILPLSVTALSGMFFGFIDTLMLGHYVDATYIGYYSAAFGLIGAAGTLISFMGGALLPIFSRMKNAPLERVFKRVRILSILIGLFATIFTFFAAKYILLIYGPAYLPGTLLLQIFSLLLIVIPITSIYESYLMSQEKTLVMAWVLIASTIMNIVLNYFFINIGLRTSMFDALLGACIATIISKIFYLAGLIIFKLKGKNKLDKEL